MVLVLLLMTAGIQGTWAQTKQFPEAYQTVKYVEAADYDLQLAENFVSASYSINATTGAVGDVGDLSITGDGSIGDPYKIHGVAGGGAIRIKAQESDQAANGNDVAYYILIVAYATGNTWNFTTVTKAGDWTDGGTRWTYNTAVSGDNAFIVPETAGLIFNTAANGLSVCEKDDPSVFQYVGISGVGSSFTIPALSAGDVVELNWKTDGTYGKLYSATNVSDLSGTTISEEFTIADGMSSFIVNANGDVTFTLRDAGTTDILSIRTYSGNYVPTMSTITLSGGGVAPTYILLDNAAHTTTFNSSENLNGTAGADHAKYIQKSVVGSITGLSLTEAGVLNATSGYGKVTVRLNDYTVDNKYLIGYTPDGIITYGSKPHQTYPYTWDFTNISGGAVNDNSDNAYNSVSKDYDTWANLGNYRFGLYTDTGGGSFYVPGATLVAKDSELNRDEFAGLGFTGGLYFQTADGTADTEPIIDGSGEYTLLEYTLTSANVSANADGTGDNEGYWIAGNGFVKFGSTAKRIESAVAAGGAAYQMDGGGSKHILLKPKRAFRNGDVITFKGYYTAAAASTGSNYGMSFRNEASQSVPYLAAVFIPAGTAKDTEVTLTYTVTRGDGIAGLSEVYVFRANSTTFLTAVSVTTTDHTAGANYGKRITASSSEPLVITIPDLNANDYIFIMSSKAPTITNATAAVSGDGLDAASGVYKYKVTENGDCEATFAANTTIERIGVTNCLKQLTTISEKGWATESRNHAIDYNLTGVFTLNDVDAKYATVDYDVQKATITLNEVGDYGVPASTGLVLNMNSVTNLSSANALGVPLFAPAISTTTLTTANIGFNGSMGNVMQPNVTSRVFTTEREDADGTNNDSGTFTRFILATKFMKWKKVGDAAVTHDVNFTDGNVPVFYRMHIYTVEEASAMTPAQTADALNTLGANKAYLSLHTANLPDALWKVPSSAKPFIPILGESDMEEIIEGNNGVEGNSLNNGTYNLSGQRVNDNGTLPPGIYIRDGKKILVK